MISWGNALMVAPRGGQHLIRPRNKVYGQIKTDYGKAGKVLAALDNIQ